MHSESITVRIQKALKESGIPAWLFYGFHAIDPIGAQILGFPESYHATRRWFYLIPANGEPSGLVHRIESQQLKHLPGQNLIYLRWQELHTQLQALLKGQSRVAMQYSPKNEIPYISQVDAGTLELVRSIGIEVESSANLIQHIQSVWKPDQLEGHRRVAAILTQIVQDAFQFAASRIGSSGQISEFEVQSYILKRFEAASLETDSPPIVGVNKNSANPHYTPSSQETSPIRANDFLLIDLWAKEKKPGSVFADITWTGHLGRTPDSAIRHVFNVVRSARDAGLDFLKDHFARGVAAQGWEVDDAVRKVIQEEDLAEHFVHRTGHNLGEDVHGTGVHFDNLESHDSRQVIAGLGCTIEPGIYLDRFGIRSEINVYLGKDGPELTTPPQNELLTFDL